MRRIAFITACCSVAVCTSPISVNLRAAEPTSNQDRKFFENKIRPVLVEHCYQCHSSDAKELGGNLMLDQPNAMLQGGDSGAAFVAGQPDKSLIIQALRYDDLAMPPDAPLGERVINDFVQWIERGAADPRSEKSDKQAATQSIDRESLWSFFPRTRPSPPTVNDTNWPRDPIDHFVLAGIEANGLKPTLDANPRDLIRRLYFDLIGLRPSIQQISAFEDDWFLASGDRRPLIAKWIDALLENPEFGQRWARHWLDVARYGESNGDDGLGRNATFPHAWRYRDYVIDRFNRDVPYDQFLIEQIAGDLMPATNADERNRQLTATGFLAIGSKPASAMNKNFAMDVVDDQINVVCTAVMGLSVACARCHDHKHDPIAARDYYALAGIFSSTETLYGLAGNEKLTAPPTELHELRTNWTRKNTTPQTQNAPTFSAKYIEAVQSLAPHIYVDFAEPTNALLVPKDVKFTDNQYAAVETANIRGEFPTTHVSYTTSFWFKNDTGNLARPITAYLFSRGKLGDKSLPGDHLGIGGKHDKNRSGRLFVFNGNNGKTSVAGDSVIPPGTWNHVILARNETKVTVFLNGRLEIDADIPPTFRRTKQFCLGNRSDQFAPLVGNLAHFAIYPTGLTHEQAIHLHEASGIPIANAPIASKFAMGVRDKRKPNDCKIHINGDSVKLGAAVPRGFPSVYERLRSRHKSSTLESTAYSIATDRSGRMQLARWLTDPNHPQTARVMVNRVWMHMFGQPIVATPDDFGVYGARPTHPELLDHLANRFVDGGWSIKRLIRQIALTRTYQLSSRASTSSFDIDPENRWLARHLRRRMDAETLRDSILQTTGSLDHRPAQGSAVEGLDQLINWPPGEATDLHRESNHRSIYLCMLRHASPPDLAAFDLPDGVEIAGRRDQTTLPTQALFMLNSKFVVQQADALASTVLLRHTSDEGRTTAVFHHLLQRDPDRNEVKQVLSHVNQVCDSLVDISDQSQHRVRKAWASVCQALLSTNEFRYID